MTRKMAEEDEGVGGGRHNGGGIDCHQSHLTPPISPRVDGLKYTEGNEDLMVPNGRDYCIAVFFIIFGTVAIVAGLASNILKIVKGDDG